MRPTAVVLIAIATILLSGCVTTELKSYQARGLTLVPIEAEHRRSLRSGHFIVKGESTVLEVFFHDPGNPLAIDDERCSFVLIELPATADSLPATVYSPRAFLRKCACVWGNCIEEESLGGEVRIRQISSLGIRATVDLRFPSQKVRRSGLFALAKPELWDVAGTPQEEAE